jgi:S1-C subfamily serine protease
MFRQLIRFAALVLLAAHARADDAIPPETVDAVKKATVFVRVQGTGWKASGSGFVVAAEKDYVLVATNYHVIASPEFEKKPRLTPGELSKSLKAPTITGVFDGGTNTEQSLKAEAIAADPEADLAIIKISGLKTPPTPIDLVGPPKLSETMQVYTFGFPFGQALATGKGAPAITVGKGSISSLRLDTHGELTLVQIDGALNPGNSGGPVVDAKGRLVGVAVATIKNGQGIGFAVPGAELGKMMKGRLGGIHVTASKGADGKLSIKAEVGLIDPSAAIRGVTLHYLVVAPKGTKPPSGELIEKQAGAKKLALKIETGIASGEVVLDSAEGELFVQAVPDGGPGAGGLSPVRNFALVVPKSATGSVVLGSTGEAGAVNGGKLPSGWSEHSPKDKTYVVWIPPRSKAAEREIVRIVKAQRIKTNVLIVEMPGGLEYMVQEVILPPAIKATRDELANLFRDAVVGEAGGKAGEETDVKMAGTFAGKEYLIESDKAATRVRIFVIGKRVFVVKATGSKEQVTAEEATTFLASVRLPEGGPPAGGQVATGPGPGAANNGPRIQGGGGDPEFKDLALEGGLLVGLEVGLGKFFDKDVVRSVRAVYRVGDKESLGEQRGTDTSNVVKVIAKPGYAVGSIMIKTGLGVDGLSVTFMKVNDRKLDPKDSYESEWLGIKGPGTVKIGGDGTTVIGILGKANAKDVTGLGLAYVGEKPYPPGKPTQIQGGVFDSEFRDGAPAGGHLVGLEIGLGKFVNNDVIRAVRPIYRVGGKDSFGEQVGKELDRVVTVLAKPGYAIGAMTVKAGLTADGLSVTFMKIVDGGLDPKDSYESDWVGGMGGGGPVKLGGDGTQVVGIVGKMNASNKSATGVGLLLKQAEKK